jgi:hypothetical protein
MKISIVNSYYLQISIDNKIVYNEISNKDDLSLILINYLPSVKKVNEIYIYTGPGSLTAVRNVMAFILGYTINNCNIKIFYIDIVKDWYLKKWPHYKIIVPFTSKKFLLGYEENGYQYKFIDNINDIEGQYWIDYSIKKFSNIIIDDNKIKYWDSNDLFDCCVESNNYNNIIEYKSW